MADTPSGEPKVEPKAEPKAEAAEHGGSDRRGRRRKGKGERERSADDGERRNSRDSRKGGRGGGGGRGRDRDRDRGRHRNDQTLTAGLFAGVADREMPCRIAGCTNTWTWFGTQQIRSLGKPEPKRMCSEHLAQLEGIEDREMPCRNSWCTRTWTWTRAAQLHQRERQEKLKPPHRLCDHCFNEERTTEDLLIECKIPECHNTWLWPRQAQLRHRAWVRRQQAKLEADEADEAAGETAEAKAPGDEAEVSGEADEASGEVAKAPSDEAEASGEVGEAGEATSEAGEAPSEAAEASGEAGEATSEAGEAPSEAAEASGEAGEATSEAEAPSEAAEAPGEAAESQDESVEGAAESAEAEASPDAEDADADAKAEPKTSGKKRKRKRKRKRKIHEGPPEKLCERCFERMGHLEPIEVPCKVHGCTNTWTWEREGQLRAWASLDSREEVTELPQPPRRMCNSCFEFVRNHVDREVACGRPGCEKTWTYKIGAQLQDFLAGRTQAPIRLCDDCSRSQFVVRSARGVELPAGAEVMPCMTAGCGGSWVYTPGMQLSPADPDATEPPIDRMCDDCRSNVGAPGRDPRRVAVEVDAATEPGGTDDGSVDPDPDAAEGAEAADTAVTPEASEDQPGGD